LEKTGFWSSNIRQNGGKSPEWRGFTTATAGREENEEAKTRMHFSLARSDMDLTTIIGRTNKDVGGNKLIHLYFNYPKIKNM